MIVTIKNLQQQTFTIEFDATKTVLQLKEEIFKERGADYVVGKQKLIYAGVILEDGRSVESYNVDEKKFLVVMLKRNIVTDTSAATATATDAAVTTTPTSTSISTSTSTSTATSTSMTKSGAKTDKKIDDQNKSDTVADKIADKKNDANKKSNTPEGEGNINTSESSQTTDSTTSSQRSTAESNLLMGDEYNRSIESIIEMGYPREMVERAMVASFNNPERAVEYLISGIPESSSSEGLGAASDILQENVASSRRNEQNVSSDASSDDPFEFLRNQPQFLQMRSLINQNPDLLQAVLQQIGQTNPALLQLISNNQDAFLSMLNQPVDDTNGTGRDTNRDNINTGSSSQNQSVENAANNTSSDGQEPTRTGTQQIVGDNSRSSGDIITNSDGITTIRISPEDQVAINRLKALGFPESLVLQAYFACDKDEQLAANFLIASSFDD